MCGRTAREGRTSIVWLVKFTWISRRLLDYLDHPDQQKCKPTVNNYGSCMHVDCTSGFRK